MFLKTATNDLINLNLVRRIYLHRTGAGECCEILVEFDNDEIESVMGYTKQKCAERAFTDLISSIIRKKSVIPIATEEELEDTEEILNKIKTTLKGREYNDTSV